MKMPAMTWFSLMKATRILSMAILVDRDSRTH